MTVLDKINEVLFLADPMKTGCVENGLENEYIEEAISIYNIVRGISSMDEIKSSVKIVFDKFFWEGCLDDVSINDLVEKIQLVLN